MQKEEKFDIITNVAEKDDFEKEMLEKVLKENFKKSVDKGEKL